MPRAPRLCLWAGRKGVGFWGVLMESERLLLWLSVIYNKNVAPVEREGGRTLRNVHYNSRIFRALARNS